MVNCIYQSNRSDREEARGDEKRRDEIPGIVHLRAAEAAFRAGKGKGSLDQ